MPIWFLVASCAAPDEPLRSPATFTDTSAKPSVTVRVHAPPQVALIVSNPAGEFVATYSSGTQGDVVLSVPERSTLSTVEQIPRLLEIRSIQGVQDGDELWLRDPLPVEHPNGEYRITVTTPPAKATEVWVSTGACGGFNGVPLPLEQANRLWADCFDATGALNALAAVGLADGGYAVASHPNVPVYGTPPTLEGHIQLDTWDLDPGVLEVTLEPPEEALLTYVQAEGWRHGLPYLSSEEPLHTRIPAPQGFFTHIRGIAAAMEALPRGNTRFRQAWRYLGEPAAAGGVTTMSFTSEALGPPVEATVDWEGGVIDVSTTPEDCAGQPFGLLDVQLQVASPTGLVLWHISGAPAAQMRLPDLDPAISVSLAPPGAIRSATIVLQTVVAGWDALRNAPDLRWVPALGRTHDMTDSQGCDTQLWLSE